MAPAVPADPAPRRPTYRAGFDFLAHLEEFLRAPPPETLLILGPAGSGKSTLLRTLITRLRPPGVFLAYRVNQTPPELHRSTEPDVPSVSLLLVDPNVGEGSAPKGPAEAPSHLMGFAPTAAQTREELPPPLMEAIVRLASQGGGYVVVDTWDAASEREFRTRAGDGAAVHLVSASAQFMRAQFGRLPVRAILAQTGESDPSLLSESDGVIDLGWEEEQGFRIRVLNILKLRHTPAPESRYLYSLDGGHFYCPPQFAPGFRPPVGPPDADPTPDEPSLFPGSTAFAEAFGRLSYRGLTAIEVPNRFTAPVGDVFLYPLVAHTISVGGRVVWVPSAGSGAAQIVHQLERFVPPDFLRDRLRVLSAGGEERGLGDLRSVVMPVRREASEGGELRAAIAPAVAPLFPDAYRFLLAAPEGRPSLYVIFLDGIAALASVAEIPMKVETYPLVVSSYMRIPRFHGFGFGRADDPITQALLRQVDTHLRVSEKYGRTLLFGMRPRTNPYILDWTDDSGRYSLVPVR